VTISGQNFTGVTAVKFNGKSAAFTVVSPTQITGKISVTAPAGTVLSAISFTKT
jgi:large repetitive protein